MGDASCLPDDEAVSEVLGRIVDMATDPMLEEIYPVRRLVSHPNRLTSGTKVSTKSHTSTVSLICVALPGDQLASKAARDQRKNPHHPR